MLNLAVDGQEKTIRTLNTQLEDTKEALLQEISQQPAPAGGRHRGDSTQTGPSLVALRAACEDITQTLPADGSPRAQSASAPPGGPQPASAAVSVASGGGGSVAAVSVAESRRAPTLVETATSPVPEPEPVEPGLEPEPEPSLRAAPPAGAESGPMNPADETNQREVQRLLAALDAKVGDDRQTTPF